MKTLYEDLAFVVYPVSDMQRARTFYSGTMELTETANWDDVWIEYDIGNGTLAITNTFGHLVPGARGATVAIEVSDLEQVGDCLGKKGIPWATGPFDTPSCKGGSIRDPDRNEIIFHQRKTK